jgi:hypothetical protein
MNSNQPTSGDSSWRTSNATQASWIDNRPVLSRIKGWFNRGDNSNTNTNMRTERIEPIPTPTRGEVILEPGAGVPETYRRLPTTNEPPLAAPVPAPAAPRNIAPTPIRPVPVAPSVENPPVIEIEPISFRPAGQARGVVNAAQTAEVSKTSEVSQRHNPISPRFTEKVGQPGDYSWITGQLEIRGNSFILHYATPETIDRFGGNIVLSGVRAANDLRSGDLVSAHGAVVEQPGRAPLYQVTTVDLVER